MAKNKINPKWVPLAKKLKRAETQLTDAMAKHQRAMDDATAKMQAANATLRKAISDARGLVQAVADIPPGEYPAITDKK